MIESPGYPRRYKNNQICIWRIIVRRGYKIKLTTDMKDGFGLEASDNCLTADSLIISAKRQTFQRYKPSTYRTGSHSLILCGSQGVSSPILSPSNELWIRFKADRRKAKNQIGFMARFAAFDVNECQLPNRGGCDQICINTPGSFHCTCRLGYNLLQDQRSCEDIDECALGEKHHGCSHQCNNFKGTYHCSCPYGKSLDSSQKNCTGGVDFKVLFTKPEFLGYVDLNAALGSKVVTVKAQAVSTDEIRAGSLKYSIIREDESTTEKDFMFRIGSKSGDIRVKKPLVKLKGSVYFLIVKASLDKWIYGKVGVLIHINSPNITTNVTASKRSFTVLVHHGLRQGHPIFDLSQHFRSKGMTFTYQLNSFVDLFSVNRQTGFVYTAIDLNNASSLSGTFREDLDIIVFGRDSHGRRQLFRCKLIIILLPKYPGENYLTSNVLQNVAKKISNDVGFLDGRVRFLNQKDGRNVPLTSVGLHRLFRKPSQESRQVSKAKLYFDTVLEEVQGKVKESYSGEDQNGPVFLNLGTGQIVSPETLSRLVEASKCKEALLSPRCIDHQFHSRYRTFDGSCNNVENPVLGAATTPFHRLLPAKYYDVDGLSDPIGFPGLPEAPDLPSPHEISQLFFIPSPIPTGNAEKFSLMLMQWGQFVDHDITFTAESEGGHHCVIPRCDGSAEDFANPCFPVMYPGDIGDCTMFIRSAAVCQTRSNQVQPREQMNTATSYLDASMVYGSSEEHAKRLRKLDGSGELKLQNGVFLPFIDAPLNPPLNFCLRFGGCFDAGDVRVNEQVALASLHTLFVREHNRIARILHSYNTHWEDTRIYEESRKIVGALVQHTTYHEFIPKILGKGALHKYRGYKPNINPAISNVFATAAFRFGHSLVRPGFPQLNSNFDPVDVDLPLFHAFFNNTLLLKTGIERFMFGLIANKSETVDRKMAYGLIHQLFQRPGASHGFNLAALNIQRGRDHGLAGYGAWRRFCKLPLAYTFDETDKEIKDPNIRAILKILYNDRVDYADLLVAGFAEDAIEGALVGPTFHCLLKEQFERLRDGDRFYYKNANIFTRAQLQEIRKSSLAKVMCDNLKGMVSVQQDVFSTVDKFGTRINCDRIPGINLEKWQENTPVSDGSGRGEWSDWVASVRLPSGTWATKYQNNVCFNKTVTDIECQTADGMPHLNAGENTVCDKRFGIYCRDLEQKKKDVKCRGYRFRFKCLDFTPRVDEVKPKQADEPRQAQPASMNCTKSKLFRRREGLQISYFTERDYAAVFPASDEVVLDRPYEITSKQPYLIAGKVEQDSRKRFLIKFDLRRIKRYDVVHSATLQLFFVGKDESYTGNSLQGYFPRALTVETYLITGTNWSSRNVTSRIPWHRDYLELGRDTSTKRLSSATIPTEQSTWVELDVYRAVYRWRISSALKAKNYGLLVMVADDDYPEGVYRFASSSHSNHGIRPRLLVCMTSTAW